MAIAIYSDIQENTANGRNIFPFGNTFDRLRPLPLEKYSVFPDYDTARAYAAGEGNYEGLPYEGQIISVSENGKQVVYIIDTSATDNLRKMGSDIAYSDITYTVNGKFADNGNFTINAEDINAAPAVHTHSISDVTSLQTVLEQKSNAEHTHTMVTGITVNNQTLTGDITINGSDNVNVRQNGSNIDISFTPYETDCTNSIVDAGNANKNYQIFVGTDAEWNEFKQTINDSANYLVFIRS